MKYLSFDIPQDTIFDPLLFLIYMNDIGAYINDDKVFLTTYTDDTNVLIIEIRDTVTKLNKVFTNLCNSLVLDPEKKKYSLSAQQK